ncbi:unnamed protein product [Natator depressus]
MSRDPRYYEPDPIKAPRAAAAAAAARALRAAREEPAREKPAAARPGVERSSPALSSCTCERHSELWTFSSGPLGLFLSGNRCPALVQTCRLSLRVHHFMRLLSHAHTTAVGPEE